MLRSGSWPVPTNEQLRQLSKILVVDDKEFEYVDLFRNEGYHIDKWPDIRNLQQLETGEFHVILLDMRGIGAREHLERQGAGLIEHIKSVNPAQYVIAYSSSQFTMHYHEFFAMADDRLPKSSDYARFKRSVDTGLANRFSQDYYMEKIEESVQLPLSRGLRRKTARAMRKHEPDLLQRALTRAGIPTRDIDRALTVVSVASNALVLLQAI